MSTCLVDRDNARIDLDDIKQECLVTHAAEFVFFLLGREARKIVFGGGLEASDIASNFRRERNSLGWAYVAAEDFAGEKDFCLAFQELIVAERFFIEEETVCQVFVDTSHVAFLRERGRVDAEVVHQTARYFAIRNRRFNGPCTAIAKKQPATRA